MMLLLFVLSLIPTNVHSYYYYFNPSNRISYQNNWAKKDKPCIDDHMVMEESENTVAYFDKSMQLGGILLPSDGALYFEDGISIGKNGPIQCPKRKSPEDVFFDVENPFGSWFDPANWDSDREPILHMNQVPSAADDAYFANKSFQMYLEKAAKVSSLTFGGRTWTSGEFENLLYTVEGQFKVSLGHEVGRKAVLGGIEFNVPRNVMPIQIEKTELDHWDAKLGLTNSNSKPETLSRICQYVKCNSTKDICVDAVKPFGHCCEICGAVVNFSMSDGNRDLVYGHIREKILDAKLQDFMHIYMERMDPNAAPIEFQVSLFPKKTESVLDDSKTDEHFNEDKFVEAVELIENVLDSHISGVASTMIQHSSFMSKIDRKQTLFSRIAGKVIFFFMMCGIVYYVLTTDTEVVRNFRTWLRQKRSKPSNDVGMRVIWRRGETEDVIVLENPNHEPLGAILEREEKETSLEENIENGENIAGCSTSRLEQEEQNANALITIPSNEKLSEEDVEMSLIEL